MRGAGSGVSRWETGTRSSLVKRMHRGRRGGYDAACARKTRKRNCDEGIYRRSYVYGVQLRFKVFIMTFHGLWSAHERWFARHRAFCICYGTVEAALGSIRRYITKRICFTGKCIVEDSITPELQCGR